MAIQSAEEMDRTLRRCGVAVKRWEMITARDDAIRADAMEFAADKAREYAAHYSPGSDGNNTFTILADWFEHRARAPSPAQSLAPAAGERSEETGDAVACGAHNPILQQPCTRPLGHNPPHRNALGSTWAP